MSEQPPSGQGPIDPRGAFGPPPPPPPAGTPGPQWNAGPTPPPPPMMPPYPPPYPYPAPPRERSFARAIFMTLATSIFGLSLALNLYLLLVSGILGHAQDRQAVIVEGSATQKVAVVPLNGLIADAAAERFGRLMDRVRDDQHIKALVIEVDSPGGTVTAADQIYHRISQFRSERPGVPIVVSMGGLATSGGYYVACAADEIFAQQTTMTGNIGVLLPRFNFSGLMQKWGIEETTIEATGATFKNAGSPFRPERPQDVQYLQGLADAAFTQFKAVVSEGRKGKLQQPLEQIADGRVYMANEALSLGLVDKIGYPDDAYTAAANRAKLTNKQVVRFEEPPSLLQLFSSESRFRGAGAGTTINGINVQVDSSALGELLTPRLMYLWTGQ